MPGPTFFLYAKLLISLLNIAFFRLGQQFSLRDYRGEIFGGPYSTIIIAQSENPIGKAGLGKNTPTHNQSPTRSVGNCAYSHEENWTSPFEVQKKCLDLYLKA